MEAYNIKRNRHQLVKTQSKGTPSKSEDQMADEIGGSSFLDESNKHAHSLGE